MLSILGQDFTVSKTWLEGVLVSIAPKLLLDEEKEILKPKVFSALFELLETPHLYLANSLTSQVKDLADFFERNASAIGNVQSAGIFKLPHIEVGEIQLD